MLSFIEKGKTNSYLHEPSRIAVCYALFITLKQKGNNLVLLNLWLFFWFWYFILSEILMFAILKLTSHTFVISEIPFFLTLCFHKK